jgi:hypothetical protein
MIFPEYEKTGVIYHIVSLNDLKNVLRQGIQYDDKITYHTKYHDFHKIIDDHRTENIPPWVIREKAIFASLNYPKKHKFHSHTAILAIRIDPLKCWIANENYANAIYEPFILQEIEGFHHCRNYLETEGRNLLLTYWDTSLSFQENLERRYDRKKGYDAEVLIQHAVDPKDIEIKYILSDHQMLNVEEWRRKFCNC